MRLVEAGQLFHALQVITELFITLGEIYENCLLRNFTMSKIYHQPFLTPIEIIRIIAVAIDTKASNKKLDGFTFKYDHPHTLPVSLFNEVITAPLAKYINPRLANLFTNNFSVLMQRYMSLVSSISMDGIHREDTERVITSWVLDSVAIEFNLFMGKIDGPNLLARNSSDDTALQKVFDWLSQNIEWWDSFYQYIPKEKRHRIKLWKNNTEIPELSTITNMPSFLKNSPVDDNEWQDIKAIILFARFLDALKVYKSDLYPERLVNTSMLSITDVKNILLKKKDKNINWLKELGEQGLEIDYALYKKESFNQLTNSQRKQYSKEAIDKLEASTIKHDKFNMQYWLNWYRARWSAFDGDLDSANNFFKEAFDQSLFFAGPSMKGIIQEALPVAASLSPQPDKTFIKRLKNSAIMFGIELPLYKEVSTRSENNRFDSVVEEWEVEMYRSTLSEYFPSRFKFNDETGLEHKRIGPLHGTFDSLLEPNYRSPNKKVEIGETWQKRMPQLVYFSHMNQVDIVAKLLNKRANVNVLSDSNESALIFSLLQLDVLDPSSSMDDRLFEYLSAVRHNHDIINTKTSKKKLLPLTCAVDTGRPDIVKKIIEMGANINFRGNTDNLSGLFLVVSRIAMLKSPSAIKKKMQSHPVTPELLDTMKRHSNGLMGVSLDQVETTYAEQLKNPLFIRIQNTQIDLLIERVNRYMTMENMREIANVLINSGADTNARHKTLIDGFTPLMLAAELDEVSLFIEMLKNNGNPFLTCKNPGNGLDVNCLHIAIANKSQKVLKYLYINQHLLSAKYPTH